MTDKFSHLNDKGEANMVDVGAKPIQERVAKAAGKIFLQEKTLQLIQKNAIEKGDIFSVARIAGIQAAKNTFNLIPLCHQLQLTKIAVDFEVEKDGICTFSMVKCNGKTGVEMEALTAVNVALLTIYDMCKAVDKQMMMSDIKLVEKTKK
jgi:cyclic pyranopterin phosphate synthase